MNKHEKLSVTPLRRRIFLNDAALAFGSIALGSMLPNVSAARIPVLAVYLSCIGQLVPSV